MMFEHVNQKVAVAAADDISWARAGGENARRLLGAVSGA
jgi:hypothetical protein